MHAVCGRVENWEPPGQLAVNVAISTYNFRDGGMIFLGEDLSKERIWN